MLATHFIAEGAKRGERGVLAIFEEHPEDYLARAKKMGPRPREHGGSVAAEITREGDRLRLVYDEACWLGW